MEKNNKRKIILISLFLVLVCGMFFVFKKSVVKNKDVVGQVCQDIFLKMERNRD